MLRPTPWLLWLESPQRAPLVGAAGVPPEEFVGVVCLRLKPFIGTDMYSSPKQRAPRLWTLYDPLRRSESEWGSPSRDSDTMTLYGSPYPPGQVTPPNASGLHPPPTPGNKTVKKFKGVGGRSFIFMRTLISRQTRRAEGYVQWKRSLDHAISGCKSASEKKVLRQNLKQTRACGRRALGRVEELIKMLEELQAERVWRAGIGNMANWP